MKHLGLEYRAEQIELALADRAPVRVIGGSVTRRGVRFRLVPALGVGIQKVVRLKSELSARLGIPVQIRPRRQEGIVEVEIAGAGETIPLIHLVASLTETPRLAIVLGLDESAIPLLLHLPSPGVQHVLITGEEGSGQINLLQAMVLSLAMLNSPGQTRFVVAGLRLRGLSHLLPPWPVLRTSILETNRALNDLTEIVTWRLRQKIHVPRIVVVVNSLSCLDDRGRDLLLGLTQAHLAGIHVIATSRAPTKRDEALRGYFPALIVGNGEPGEFQLQVKNQVIPFQAATVTQEEIASIIAQLHAKGRTPGGPGGQQIWVEETQPSRPRWRIGWGRLGL